MIVGALMGFSSKTVARLLKQTIWVFFSFCYTRRECAVYSFGLRLRD